MNPAGICLYLRNRIYGSLCGVDSLVFFLKTIDVEVGEKSYRTLVTLIASNYLYFLTYRNRVHAIVIDKGIKKSKIMYLNSFSSIHLCVTHLTTKEGVADSFLKDVRECCASLMKEPHNNKEGMVSIYQTFSPGSSFFPLLADK